MNFTELRKRILAVVPQGISVHFSVFVTDSEWTRADQIPPFVVYRLALLHVRGEQLHVEAGTPEGLWKAFRDQIVPKLESSIPTDESITELDSIGDLA